MQNQADALCLAALRNFLSLYSSSPLVSYRLYRNYCGRTCHRMQELFAHVYSSRGLIDTERHVVICPLGDNIPFRPPRFITQDSLSILSPTLLWVINSYRELSFGTQGNIPTNHAAIIWVQKRIVYPGFSTQNTASLTPGTASWVPNPGDILSISTHHSIIFPNLLLHRNKQVKRGQI